MTLTGKLQLEFAATVAPDKVIVVAVVVTVPPQNAAVPGATDSPTGSGSVKPTPVRASPVFGLTNRKLRAVMPFTAMLAGLKALSIDGGARTPMLAEAVPPAPASLEATGPLTLFFTPRLVPVTFTVTVQFAPPASVIPDALMLLEPAVAVRVPTQVPSRPLGVATSRPDGRLSVKPMPVTGVIGLGLVSVKLRPVVALSGTVAAPKALLMLIGARIGMLTVTVWLSTWTDAVPVPLAPSAV